jgi:hypothetical protein
MEVETVKLSRIVMEVTPEFYPFLKQSELDSVIVLRDGIHVLEPKDAVEIIQHSIYQQQKETLLH